LGDIHWRQEVSVPFFLQIQTEKQKR
jgi:hypothetical protein